MAPKNLKSIMSQMRPLDYPHLLRGVCSQPVKFDVEDLFLPPLAESKHAGLAFLLHFLLDANQPGYSAIEGALRDHFQEECKATEPTKAIQAALAALADFLNYSLTQRSSWCMAFKELLAKAVFPSSELRGRVRESLRLLPLDKFQLIDESGVQK
ncbi:MAG: hypothetical protein AB7F31_04810 [Parachlamydiales bacterium]